MNAFSRTALRVATGSGVIATALISFTGVPAQATSLCDGVSTILPTEAALRAALLGSDPVICIDEGPAIDFGVAGVDGDASPIVIDRSVTIVGLGNVTFDGHGETNFLTTPMDGGAYDVTLQNITFQNGHQTNDYLGTAIAFGGSGTLTVLDSTFTGNSGYGIPVVAYDTSNVTSSPSQPKLIIDNSTFTNNGVDDNSSLNGGIAGYGNLTVTNTTFARNHGGSVGAVFGAQAMTVQNNVFNNNTSNQWGGAVLSLRGSGDNLVSGQPIDISNNTFFGNAALVDGGAIYTDRDASIANNTFVDNEVIDPSGMGDAIYKTGDATVGLVANIFASSPRPTVTQLSGPDLGGQDINYVDFGANISTSANDASQLPVSNLVTGHVGATWESLHLSDLADNGGPTQTMALGDGSIAIGATTPAIRAAAGAIAPPLADQRGFTRGDGSAATDSGAFEVTTHVVPEEPAALSNTGLSPVTGLVIGGATLLGGAAIVGAALATQRRRRQSV